MINTRHKIIIKIVISFLFLSYILVKVDLSLFAKAFLSIKPEYYFISFLVVIVNSYILALKYKIIMKPSGIYQPLSSLVKINFICRFYSMFLTTAVGQGLIRWHISTKNQKGRSNFLVVMIFERSTFLFALCSAVMISLVFTPGLDVKNISDKIYPLLTVVLLLLLLFFFYINFSPFYSFINKAVLWSKNKTKTIIISKLYEIIKSFSLYHGESKIMISSLFLAFVWHLLFLLRVYILIISIQVPLGFIQLSWMASLVLLLQALPVSLNGIGLRETAYAFLFRIQDLPPENGVLLGALFFSQMFLMAAIGGVLHLLSKE